MRAGPTATVVLGAVGSGLVAVGGYGVGAVPAPLADTWLHESGVGRALSMALCAGGVLALLYAWWRLRGAASGAVLLAAGAWSVPLLLTPPLFSRDVYAYAGQAHLVTLGLDPYAHGPADAAGPLSAEVDDVWGRAHSPYGPVFLRLASWLVPGQHVFAAVLLLRVLALVGLVLIAWALRRLAADPPGALWLGVANPLVLLHGIGGAHNDVLMAGLLAAGLAVAASAGGRDSPRTEAAVAAGAAIITAAALVKAPAAAGLAFVPFLVRARRLRAAVVVAITAVVVSVGLTAASGLGWGWLHTLGAGNARRSLLSVSTGAGVLASNVAGDGAVRVAHGVGLAVAALIGLWLLIGARRTGALRALGLTLLAVVVLGPVVQPWYLIWALAVLAAVAGPRLAAALAVASAVCCLLILPGGRHVIRPPLYGLPAILVIVTAYAASAKWGEPGGRGAQGG